MHKYSDFDELKNSVLTPDLVNTAFDNLPHDYIKQAQYQLERLKNQGKVKKNYSNGYISKTKTGEVDNIEILQVLVWIGLKNKATKNAFSTRKKTSKTK